MGPILFSHTRHTNSLMSNKVDELLVFNIRKNMDFYKDKSFLSLLWLSKIFKPVEFCLYLAALTEVVEITRVPGDICPVHSIVITHRTLQMEDRSKLARERIVESSQSPDGVTQFNLNAYYLFWVSHTSCMVKQGDNFFSPTSLKGAYTPSLAVNTKWIPQALDSWRQFSSLFSGQQ